jgi:hypothetical protein
MFLFVRMDYAKDNTIQMILAINNHLSPRLLRVTDSVNSGLVMR